MTDIAKKVFTADDLLALPMGMGQRYELIEGELLTMAPAGNEHGFVAGAVFGKVFMYLQTTDIGVGLAAETGFYTRGDKSTVRTPDYAFLTHQKIPEDGLPKGFSDIVPDLVAEVVSPNDSASYVEQKTLEWLAFGVRLVWVIYPDSQRVHVYQQGERNPVILTAEDTLTGGDVLPGFKLPVRNLFEK
jgi:Uma2 family endonuclease